MARLSMGRVVLASALLLVASAAAGNEQPDQLVTGRKLLIKHKSDTSRSKIVFLSKDSSFVLPNPGSDPTVEGATLQILDMATGAGATLALPAAHWKAISGGYKYADPSGACRTVIIKQGRLLKGVCKGAAITLMPPLQGGLSAAAGVILRVGTDTIRYCAVFPNPTKNEGGGGNGKFLAKASTAPAACPLCGDGVLDAPDEACDDGNNTSGDCCSASCQLEPNGGVCDDGNPCTTGGICSGGICNADSLCGNGVVDGGCGELCDGSDDDACAAPGLCGADCTCTAPPVCEGDPSRFLFIGFEDGCQSLNNQGTCDLAYIRHPAGVTSCWWEGTECLDCTPTAQTEGLCRNSCDPVTCPGDLSRTTFVGGPGYSVCQQFDNDQASCETAFHLTGNGTAASCYYNVDTDECRGCGADNQADGSCTNACATCPRDPSRVFAGGPANTACDQFNGDEAGCNQAFQFDDECSRAVSCYYDGAICNPCDTDNEQGGECRNTCEEGPADCAKDPSRTTYAGGPASNACRAFDGDPQACNAAYHSTFNGNASSCFYDFPDGACRGCGPSNFEGEGCVNTCVYGAPSCAEDPSRSFFLGGPNTSACRGIPAGTAAQTLCEGSFHLGRQGFASCYWDPDAESCQGCGPGQETEGHCQNTCQNGPLQCEGNPARDLFAGGGQASSCQIFSGSVGGMADCEDAFHIGFYGVASCYWVGGSCRGCNWPNSSECTNECDVATCDGDPSRVVFAGGTETHGCHQFDGLPAACALAFHLSQGGVASCYYDADFDECRGCGPNNFTDGACFNSCPVCDKDPSRTTFAGPSGTSACQQFDGDQMACEDAFHVDGTDTSSACFYDSSTDRCRGCGPTHAKDGDCTDTCRYGPEICAHDPSRTVFAGSRNSSACHQFDADPIACAAAYHHGSDGIASCYFSVTGGDCQGCGSTNQGDGRCVNSCAFGAFECEQDPSRTIFVGGPNTSACDVFTDQPTCETAFHQSYGLRPTSCWWDVDGERCRGCGPGNAGKCINTCAEGPLSCANDASRSFVGGPSTGACFDLEDENACLSAYHLGRCGASSCYWSGVNCQGCGPTNYQSVQCFNTCAVP